MKSMTIVGRAIKYSDMAKGITLSEATQWQYPAALLRPRILPQGFIEVRKLPEDLWSVATIVRLAAEEAVA